MWVRNIISRDRGGAADGFILVAVLWLLAVLAALVMVYATYVITTAVAATASTNRVEPEALVNAAVELAAYRLANNKPETDPTGGSFTARLGSARVSVDFRSEAARVDLNVAPRELLSGLAQALGVAPADADRYADRIVAWRSRSASPIANDDQEVALYRAAGVPYAPRHGPFPHADELYAVYGIPALVVTRILPYVTVFSGRADVNILDAAPLVVGALPGMTPNRLQIILSERAGRRADPNSLMALLGSNVMFASVKGSKAFRLAIEIGLQDGRRLNADVVILPAAEGAGEPYHVLSWRGTAEVVSSRERFAGRP